MGIDLSCVQPRIRYVNNYEPLCTMIGQERIIYDFEMMYVMDGEAVMNYDGRKYILRKSDLFYLRPGVKNSLDVVYDKHFRAHCIHFDWVMPEPEYDFEAMDFYRNSAIPEELAEKEKLLRTRPAPEPSDCRLPTHIAGTSYEKFASLYSQCYYSFICKTPVSRLKLQAAFLEIISALAETYCTEDKRSAAHPKIIYAIEYIKENYTKHLTAPELARKYGLSPKYFGTLFKAATGVSISEFILELRLYSAKEMLIGTDMSIEKIAEKTGFANVFYFSKCFKDKERLSPTAYRSTMTKISEGE